MKIQKPFNRGQFENAIIKACFGAFALAAFVYTWVIKVVFELTSYHILIPFAGAVISLSLALVWTVWLAGSLTESYFSRRGLVTSLHHNSSIFIPLIILMGYPLLTMPRLDNMVEVLISFLSVNATILLLLYVSVSELRRHGANIVGIFTAYLLFIFKGRNIWWTISVWMGSLSVGLFLWSQNYPDEWHGFMFTNQVSGAAYNGLIRYAIFYTIAGQIAWIILGYLKKRAIGCTDEICLTSIAQCYLPLVLALGFSVDFGWPDLFKQGMMAPTIFSILAATSGGLAAYKISPAILRSSSIGEKLSLGMLLGLAIAIYIGFMASQAIHQFQTFAPGSVSTGIIDQLVYNTSHGHFFLSSTQKDIPIYLGQHTSFIWLLVSPLYLIWTDPRMLLIFQSIVLAAGAIPIFLIANDLFKSRWTGINIAGAYLLYFPLQNANISGIDEIAFAPVLLMAAFYAWMKDKTGWMLLWLMLLMSVKEELALTVAAFGLFSILFSRKKLTGFYIAVAGVTYFMIATQIIIPHFSGDAYAFTLLPSTLGANSVAKVTTFLFNPIFIIKSIVTPWPDKLFAFFQVLGPLAFAPLVGTGTLLIIIPSTLIKWMSTDPAQWGALGHSSAHITAPLFISTCYAIRKVEDVRHRILLHRQNLWTSDKERVIFALAWALLTSTFMTCYLNGSTPISATFTIPILNANERARLDCLAEFKDIIPEHASVCAQENILPHLSERRRLAIFPRTNNSDYIVLDLTGDKRPMSEQEYRQNVRDLLSAGSYGVMNVKNDLVLLRAGHSTIDNDELLRGLF